MTPHAEDHFCFLLQIVPAALEFALQSQNQFGKQMVFSAIEENALEVHRWSCPDPASS